MPFNRPTLTELVDRIQNDFVSRLQLVAPILRRSMVYAMSRVQAGAAHMLHGHLDFLSRQIFPDESDGDFLVRQGSLYGLSKNAAAFATGNLTVTGTNGTVIVEKTLFIRADGTEYKSTLEQTISSGTATVPVISLVAGANSSADVGTLVTFESPLAGASATATVASGGLSGGADQETDDEFRVRLLERLQNPPQGGAAADYVAWAKEIPGVTRAWCYPVESGPGTVTVRFVRDDDAGGIIPDSGEVATVQAHINLKAPVTAVVTVAAPTADSVAFTLHIVPDNTDTRAAVTAELTDLFRRTAQPGGTVLLSQMRAAVSAADGITDYTMTTPSADSTHATGHLAVVGTITWT